MEDGREPIIKKYGPVKMDYDNVILTVDNLQALKNPCLEISIYDSLR